MIEIERTQIHFLSDVLVAVAVFVSGVILNSLTSKNIIRVLKNNTLSRLQTQELRDTDSYTLFSPGKVREDSLFANVNWGNLISNWVTSIVSNSLVEFYRFYLVSSMLCNSQL